MPALILTSVCTFSTRITFEDEIMYFEKLFCSFRYFFSYSQDTHSMNDADFINLSFFNL